MNGVITEIEATRMTELQDGSRVPVHSHISQMEAELIRHAIFSTKPKLALEVGLAFGISTLHILDAMQKHGNGKLIGMDPAQNDETWRGGGLHNIRKAGFSEKYEFYEDKSQFVLPRLAAGGTRVQFAFVDGWHTFDHTLIDFFYVDLMLEIGGVVILDDTGYPAISRLCDFVLANRSYSVFGTEPQVENRSFKVKLKGRVQSMLHPLVRDNCTPSRDIAWRQKAARNTASVALQKMSEDSRRFDHFVPF